MEVARSWVACDFNSVEAPGVDPLDPVEAGSWLRDRLPVEFQDVAGVAQLSGSAGVKPGLRCRLWFVLDRPLTSIEAWGWLHKAGVDEATLLPSEFIYTANPAFVPASADACRGRGRWALLAGLEERVPVPERLPEAPPSAGAGLHVGSHGLLFRAVCGAVADLDETDIDAGDPYVAKLVRAAVERTIRNEGDAGFDEALAWVLPRERQKRELMFEAELKAARLWRAGP